MGKHFQIRLLAAGPAGIGGRFVYAAPFSDLD